MKINQMKNRISLDADWLMEYLIIGAMRYGATHRLVDIAKLIHNNRSKFNANRVSWLARDMREQATHRLQWLDNVLCKNDFNDRIVYDGYTAIAKHLQANTDMRFCDYDWEVDCISGKVYADKRESPLYLHGNTEYLQTLYDCDIATIVNAANIIDKSCHRIVVTEYEGKAGETLCFPSISVEQILNDKGRPTGDYTYKSQWKPLDRPHAYVPKEYVKEAREP